MVWLYTKNEVISNTRNRAQRWPQNIPLWESVEECDQWLLGNLRDYPYQKRNKLCRMNPQPRALHGNVGEHIQRC